MNKSKLFEARVLKEGLQLNPKIISMLVDHGEKMERTLEKMRVIMMEVVPKSEAEKGTSRLIEEAPSKVIPLLSLPGSRDRKIRADRRQDSIVYSTK